MVGRRLATAAHDRDACVPSLALATLAPELDDRLVDETHAVGPARRQLPPVGVERDDPAFERGTTTPRPAPAATGPRTLDRPPRASVAAGAAPTPSGPTAIATTTALDHTTDKRARFPMSPLRHHQHPADGESLVVTDDEGKRSNGD